MHGLVVVDKPLGWSSMDVVRRLRRAIAMGRDAAGLPRLAMHKIKAGHAGTLDPLATGVVICCVGRATRAVESLMGMPKVYAATVDLSAFTTTDDREGEREAVACPPIERGVIEATLPRFVGEIQQRPPAYSAIHVDGQRAYKLARRGEALQLPPRPVVVYDLTVTGYAWPRLDLTVTCGRGTYIRSLARDVGVALGTGGHLAALRRTAVGPYRVADAIPGSRLDRAITQADLLPAPGTSDTM